MDGSPFFSVIIPVYNAERTIEKCALSVLNQTFDDFELIMINDGSKDGSQKKMEEIKESFPLVKIRLINQENCGAGKTRNHGITQATGEYVAFLDSDDYWDKAFLEETKKVIDEKKADLVYIDHIREKEDGSVIRFERMSVFSNLDKEQFIRRQLTGYIPWGGHRKVIRRSLLMDRDIRYATSIKVGEESLYSYKALYYSEVYAFQSKALYHYVANETSLTANDTISNSINVYEFVRKSLENGEIDPKHEPTVRALSLTTMAIATNVLAQQRGMLQACREAKTLYAKYRDTYMGELDVESLEKRVRICYPWIKLGISFPVVLAGKVQKLMRRK